MPVITFKATAKVTGKPLKLNQLGAMKTVAAIIDRHVQLSIANGQDFNGKALKPVQKWTRKKTKYNPKSKVLNRTGTFKRSHKVKAVTEKKVVYGPTGDYIKIGKRIFKGGRSRMKIDPKQIRKNKKTGKQYVRIQANSGNWYTKRVTGGSVSIKLPPRKYIGISQALEKQIVAAYTKALLA